MRFKTTREEREEMRNTGNAASIGLVFGVALLIGFFIGDWVDHRFHTAPWGALIGVLLGIGTGFKNLFDVTNKIIRDEEEEDRKRRGGEPK